MKKFLFVFAKFLSSIEKTLILKSRRGNVIFLNFLGFKWFGNSWGNSCIIMQDIRSHYACGGKSSLYLNIEISQSTMIRVAVLTGKIVKECTQKFIFC